MGDVVAHAGERVDHRFHLIEHAVDDDGKLRERLVDIAVRKPFAQVAGDDALDPLVDLFDPLLGAHAEPRARQQAQAECRQQTQRERLADDVGDLPRLVDVAPDHQHVAILQPPADRADYLIAAIRLIHSGDPRSLHRRVDIKAGRQTLHVAGDPVPVGAEQPGKLNAAGILPQMVLDGLEQARRRQ